MWHRNTQWIFRKKYFNLFISWDDTIRSPPGVFADVSEIHTERRTIHIHSASNTDIQLLLFLFFLYYGMYFSQPSQHRSEDGPGCEYPLVPVSQATETRADEFGGHRLPSSNNLLMAPETDKCVEGGETKSRVSEVAVTHVPLVCVWAEWRGGVLTIRKQLRTLGSTLLPPNAATSPSCRGIWMASWSSRLRWRWSVKPPAPDTCRNKSATTRSSRQHRFFSICSCYLYWVQLWTAVLVCVFV